MISFTGGELFTGNIFVMTVGWLAKKVTFQARHRQNTRWRCCTAGRQCH